MLSNKKRHEVMCSCPFTCRHRQTPLLERNFVEHISRLMNMLKCIAYTLKRKHKCYSSSSIFGEFTSKDNITMLFLLSAYLSRVSDCKSTKIIPTGKKYFAKNTKKKDIGIIGLIRIIGLIWRQIKVLPIGSTFINIVWRYVLTAPGRLR